MIQLVNSVLKSSTTGSVIRGSHAGLSKAMPSVAFGGSMVAGIASMIVSGYKIVDCIRYQTRQGQCDIIIENNLPGVIAGGGVLAGCWGAFNTYNPGLRKDEQVGEVATRGLVASARPAARINRSNVNRVMQLKEEGKTQKEIAEALGTTVYEVRKLLRYAEVRGRGR